MGMKYRNCTTPEDFDKLQAEVSALDAVYASLPDGDCSVGRPQHTPFDNCPDEDESVCAWCGATMRLHPMPGTWEFDGVCDAKCAIYRALSDRGIAAGMSPPKGITADERDKILRAIGELEPAKTYRGYPPC